MTTSFRKTGAAACALIAPLALSLALPGAAHARDNAEKAEQALARENADKAVSYAERAVVENPRDPQLRVLLGQAYLKAGRMVSARDSLASAVELGDISPRTALMLALAQVGSGEQRLAIGTINMQGSSIPAADRGLALALAGETARGVEVLSSDIRAGNNTPKSRQNLAYALALDGRWREARAMAAQDVPAGEIGARITEWASTARVDMYAQRIAALMGADAVDDGGMPTHLALSNSAPSMPAAKPAPRMADAEAELPPVATPAPAARPAPAPAAKPAPVKVAEATPVKPAPKPVAAPAPAARPSKPEPVIVASLPPEPIKPAPSKPAAAKPAGSKPQLVSLAVIQPQASSAAEKPAPVAKPAPKPVAVAAAKPAAPVAKPAAKPALPTPATSGTHVAQLGSYASEDAAQAGWKVFQSRYANLRGAKPVITKASVDGKDYWRVAAGGFDSKSAYQMCSAVKASGNGCIPIAMTNGTAATKQRLAKAD